MSSSGSENAEGRRPQYYVAAEDNEDDDHDPDYEDNEEEDDEVDEDDMEHDLFEEEDEFHDAEEGHIQFLVQVEDDDDDEGGNAEGSQSPDAERTAIQQRLINLISRRTGLLSRRQVLDFLRRSNLGHLAFGEDDDEFGRRRRELDPDRFPKVPSDEGRELMDSGNFGVNDIYSPIQSKKRLARRILDRELGIGNRSSRKINQGLMAQSMIPSSAADMIINYDDNVYSGQFSDDGNFFFACVKDMKVRMYDTSNPYNWRHYKTVPFTFGSWTLTDASLSPDNKWLAYTSIQDNVCLAPTDPNDTGDPYMLNLSSTGGVGWHAEFGIFSIRFSGDGRELVAGTNKKSIVVYDIESRTVLHSIEGHDDDVNAVCFADKSSPHILYSGSDDTTIKVWDRRSMGDGREAGAFVGHIEGLTYIDSKNDGRYLISNGKDQSMKLWDLKMMYTTAQFEEKNPRRHTRFSEFDYRWGQFDDTDWFPHPDDNSLVTFRGHKVLRTLIRCHFSPPGSTNSRYVYSGSHDGKVYVYNMDATIAATIDVKNSTSQARTLPRAGGSFRQFYNGGLPGWSTVVRDASWHPNAPFIAASSLNGWDNAMGTVSLHSYNESSFDEGEPRMGTGYDEKLRPMSVGRSVARYDSDLEDEEDDDIFN
ncbi:WD40 repeat-like protein [Annulohypoxylon truncatum]|uniref:WD40 repeat-like protein n=1 Tax=Annulohypoxylon truncatum TaxID=327061 RepID=UPI0020077B69|nr:WD40 repeat-like protein [Annulohypoxylon truncatum]KAI1212552.1 WD40 repeat-like protein [Annulohypoxylon truncatum]